MSFVRNKRNKNIHFTVDNAARTMTGGYGNFTSREVYEYLYKNGVRFTEDQIRRALYAMARCMHRNIEPMGRAAYRFCEVPHHD